MPNLPSFPIPSETPENTRCIQIQIPDNDDWMQVFAGLLSQPSYWFNWQRDDAHNGTVLAQHWTKLFDQIDWSDMSCCCGDNPPAIYRYDDTGHYQQSTDGGLTWHDFPDYTETSLLWQDPNTMGIETSKCMAADGVVQTFKTQITEQIADDASVGAIVGVIVAVLLLFLSAGTSAAITAQIIGLVGLIFGAGVATWKALMTTEVWDDFRCQIYCCMDSDTSINADGLDLLLSRIDGHFSGIIAQTLHGYVKAAGVIGLTNMMRSSAGSSDADCSDCPDCDVHVWYNEVPGTLTLALPDDGTDNQYTLDAHISDGVYSVYQFFQDAPGGGNLPWAGASYASLATISGTVVNRGTYDRVTGTTTPGHWPSSDECPGGIYAESNVPFTIRITVNAC